MNIAVFGLQFGDEGKGLVTDYLCSHASKPALVVRFSGGHQCGHTVVVDGKRHIFSNFGSGTFRGVPTQWTYFCTVEPIGFMKELRILQDLGVEPEIHIDGGCPITTPYEIISNQSLEKDSGHGSCGVGFGETMKREENFYSLTFYDLFFPNILREKLKNIMNYYMSIAPSLIAYAEHKNVNLSKFLECCETMTTLKNIKKEAPIRIQDKIFEGSQGLLLDQHYGFFPNVTRSNTGTKNALEILKFEDLDEIYLVTRAYQTRHGNGFMTNENLPHNILINPNETNKDHKYQGKFRRSLLDLTLLEYGINRDPYIRKSTNKRLVITCLDHVVNEYRFTYRGEIISCKDENEFISKIAEILEMDKIYLSRSEESKGVELWKKA